MPEKKEEKEQVIYRFGKRKLHLLKPKDYPTPEEIKAPFDAELELTYAHGYSGMGPDSRQNLYLTNDGKYLVYYIAAVVVVFDFENNTQKFFTGHNDDVTALCLDRKEGSTLVASGQTDPIDRPGEGKDLPKVWIWDLKDLSKVELIDKLCWGYINKVQWSTKTNYIYILCGDEDQTLKVFDPITLTKKSYIKIEAAVGKKIKRAKNQAEQAKLDRCNYYQECLLDSGTQKEHCCGFIINPKPINDSCVDELLFFCKRKFCYAELTRPDPNSEKLKLKFKAVSTLKMNKNGEKAYSTACFLNNDGYYAVGSASGNIYIGRGYSLISIVTQAHMKSVNLLHVNPLNGQLISGAFDRMLSTWNILGDLSAFQGKKGKKCGLKKLSTKEINVKNSDMVFRPKACAFKPDTGELFVGTKSNHILRIKMDEKVSDKKENKQDYAAEENIAEILIDGHDDQIWGLASHPEADFYVTGGYDNVVKLWNSKTLKCEQTHEFGVTGTDKKQYPDSPDSPTSPTSEDEKKSKFSNLAKGKKQIVCAAWSNNGRYIIFGSEDSWILLFTYDEEKNRFRYHTKIKIERKSKTSAEENVSYLRFSPDSKVIAVAHMDSQLYLFNIKDAGDNTPIELIPWKPMVHVAAPTHIQWAANSKMVKTFTRDYEIVHWRLNYKKKIGKHEIKDLHPDDHEWADDPLIAGWDVQGCYQPEWDGTDLNDVTMSQNKKFVIGSDDFGAIRLHSYPAIDPANCKTYHGHAEFVVGVEMMRNGKTCISVGGADCAIFHWTATGLANPKPKII